MRTSNEAALGRGMYRVAITALPLLAAMAVVSTANAQDAQPPFGPQPGAQPQPPFGPQPGDQPGAQPPFGQQPQQPGAQQPGAQQPFGQQPAEQPGQFGQQPGAPQGGPPPGQPDQFSFGASGTAGTSGFGADATATAPEDAKEKEREMSLINQNNLSGSTGLLRTAHAGSGAEGTFRVSFLMDWFSTSGFLCVPDDATAGGTPKSCDGQNREDSASHIGGFFALNATPLSFLEGYALLRTYANYNDQGTPTLLQVLGDTTLGAKAFTPRKLLHPFAVGGELQLLLLNGTGDVGLAGGGTSAVIRGLGTLDLRKPEGKKGGFPLRANFNLGYKIDNSGTVVEDVETARADAFTDGRSRQPITRIERFGLGINRVDFFQIYTGVEYTHPIFQPYVEWTVDVPVNRQSYECNTATAFRGDVCLGLEDFTDANAGGPGFSAVPSRLSLGVRATPFKKAFRGLSGHLAFDIGTSGTSTFVEEVAPQAPWTMYLGIGYAFDTAEKKPPPPPPARMAPPVVMPTPQNFIRGFVHEEGKAEGIANAIVSIAGSADPPVATGTDGRFLTRSVTPGTYQLDIAVEGYNAGSCTATVMGAPAAPMGQPQYGQPGPFGQPGQPGQPPMGQPPIGQPPIGQPPAPRGDTYVDVDCVLVAQPRKGTLSGTVTDAATNAPVPAAVIRYTDANGEKKSVTANGNGQYEIVDLDPGEISMRAEATGYMNSVSSANVAANDKTTANISINKRPKKALVRVLGNEIKLSEKILFETDSARIVGDSNALLEEVATVLGENSDISLVEIQGHTDNTGSRDHNQQLSDARANAVRDWLVKAGVSSSRLTAKGYGQDRPIAPNVTAANKSKNRRVQFIIQGK